MIKSYKYRIYPNKSQIKSLENNLNLLRTLYNCALEEKISFYKKYNKSLSHYDQKKNLKIIRKEIADYNNIYSQCQQNILKRLDNTFSNLFRELKKENKAGYPRFKTYKSFNSFTYPQFDKGFKLQEINSKKSRLKLSKIGMIKLFKHINIEGNVKTLTIKRTPSGKWYAIFVCDNIPEKLLPKTNKIIGFDVGIKSLIVDSNGNTVDNPKFFKKSQNKLKKQQRKLSKLDWRIPENKIQRDKLKKHLSKTYEKITNQKEDYYHKLTNKIIKENDIICIEKLDIKSMKSFRNLNREIQNVSWYNLSLKFLYKAESAGKEIIQVNPKNTTKMCSDCGNIKTKTLSERIHHCDECGKVMDRDHNAAINILNLGLETIRGRAGSCSLTC